MRLIAYGVDGRRLTENHLLAKLAATAPFARIAKNLRPFSRERVLYGKPNAHFAIEIAEIAANFAKKRANRQSLLSQKRICLNSNDP